MANNRIIGRSQSIIDATAKVTGLENYVDDIRLPHMLYASLFLSPSAHAIVRSIDVSQAMTLEGVLAVFSVFNCPNVAYNSAAPFETEDFPKQERMFSPKVRFVGDRLAMVVAESKTIADKAVRLLKFDLEELPAVFSIKEAMLDTAPLIDDQGNVLDTVEIETGNFEEVRKIADDTCTSEIDIPSYHQGAMEPHGVVADVLDEGIVVYSPTQNIFSARMICAAVLNVPESKVRVIQSTMGGSFGSKLEIILEPLCAYAAQQLKRPVKLILQRRDVMIATRRSYALRANITSYIKEERVIGQEIEAWVDAGAYCSSGIDFIWAMSAKPFRLYTFDTIRYKATSVLTNHLTASAMRGYGSTQLITAIEMHMDHLARHLKKNPAALRLEYALPPDGVDARDGQHFGSIGLLDCITKGREHFSRPVGERWEDNHYIYGTSMALGVHGNGMYPVHTDLTTMSLKMNMDGSVVLSTGTVDMGTGANTSFKMMVAEILNLSMDDITLVHGDTSSCPFDLGCYASRSIYVAGHAAILVARSLKALLEEEEIKLREEMDIPTEESVSYHWIARHAFVLHQRDLYAHATHASQADPMSYAAHFAKVRVHKQSQNIDVQEYVAAHDVGFAINPMGAEGQIEGAVQMGMGMALQEGLKYDKRGACLNCHFKKYRLVKAHQMPGIQSIFIESIEKTGPFGAKSIGEIAAVPVPAAIVNALSVALESNIYSLPYADEMDEKR